MAETFTARGGIPHPGDWRVHRPMKGAFADGTAYATTDPIVQSEPVAGALRIRHWFKATTNGTLAYRYLRPIGTKAPAGQGKPDPYSTGNPVNIAVVANTEIITTLSELCGESLLEITFTPAAAPGTITYSDIAQI